MDQLILDTDKRSMHVIYTVAKRADLLVCINKGWGPISLHT